MRFIPRAFLLLAVAGPLCAQGEGPPDELQQNRLRVMKLLTETAEARAAHLRDFRKRWLLAQLPRDTRSELLVMPEIGDVVRLAFGNSALELHRGANEPCGRWSAAMPGPFTARAFGPHQILVAMQTGNAGPQTTVLCLARPDAAHDFVLSAHVIVDRVTWSDPDPTSQGPQECRVVAWDAASRRATLVFAWEGISRVVVGDVELASALLPSHRVVQAEALAAGAGADAIDVDGELHVFARQSSGFGREAPIRVCVRDRSGKWSKPAADVPDVLVEPEFTAWRDAAGIVHLTTPVSDIREGAPPIAQPADLVQTLRTFRMHPEDRGKWTLAATQFEWSGQLRLGQQLKIATATGRPPAVLLQTVAGEVVERSLGAPETARDK